VVYPFAPSPGDVVLFDRVALARRPAISRRDLAPTTLRPFRYWIKSDLLVRRHGAPLDRVPPPLRPVVISVAPEWRGRAAFAWGNVGRPVASIGVPACAWSQPWVVFTGGYYVRTPACVGLLVSLAGETKRLQVPLGHPC
jgi:hypothetical protein